MATVIRSPDTTSRTATTTSREMQVFCTRHQCIEPLWQRDAEDRQAAIAWTERRREWLDGTPHEWR